MAEPSSTVCANWIDDDDVFDCKPCSSIQGGDQDAVLAGEAADAASRILYLLSGQRYPGICTDTVRPCRRGAWPAGWLSAWNESWGVCGCGASWGRDCACGAGSDEILLGGAPIVSITQVLIDGAVLANTAYRVDDYRWLRRIDGQAWPGWQDLDAATTEADTWAVTYTWGRQPPADGVFAAKKLACELYQACSGGDCKLPRKATSVISQGIDITLADPNELFDAGKTGIWAVDLFLETERHGRRNLPTLTVSPDSVPSVRRAGT